MYTACSYEIYVWTFSDGQNVNRATDPSGAKSPAKPDAVGTLSWHLRRCATAVLAAANEDHSNSTVPIAPPNPPYWNGATDKRICN